MVRYEVVRSRHGSEWVRFARFPFAVVPDAGTAPKASVTDRAIATSYRFTWRHSRVTHDGDRTHRVTSRNMLNGTGYPGTAIDRD